MTAQEKKTVENLKKDRTKNNTKLYEITMKKHGLGALYLLWSKSLIKTKIAALVSEC